MSQDDSARIWRKYDDMERRLASPISRRMLDLAGLAPGIRVLDLATGRGEPAIDAAHRVAPEGSVLGVDVSAAILQLARERADAEGVTNLELRAQSAESIDLAAEFDAVLARWGLMYFESPSRALAAVRRALRSHGVFVAALWAEPERVAYFSLPRNVLQKYAPVPPIDFEVPGVCRYAHVERIHRDFAASGLTVQHIEEHEATVMEVETGAELVDWVRTFGMERLLRDLSPEIRQAWADDLVSAVRASSHNGTFTLGGTTRLVVATA